MWKKALLASVFLIGWELGILYLSGYLSLWDTAIMYQLAARYSARTSFVILVVILGWVGFTGLKNIFNSEKSKLNFALTISLFGLNHLIHFFFLFSNFQVNQLSLLEIKFVFGTIGYIAIILIPVYLWSGKRKATKSLYWGTHLYLQTLLILFLVTYIGRLSKPISPPSPEILFSFLIGISVFMMILNLYKISKEWKSEAEHSRIR